MERSRSSCPPTYTDFSPSLRRLAWLNIAVQTAFPLSVAFTPVMAGAGEQHSLVQSASPSMQRTQVYTLGRGETAASVAKKFHLTLDQLRELNLFRTFAHGFDGLQPGDDVDVPLVTARNKNTASGTSPSASVSEEDEQAQKVAGYVSQAGSFLAGGAKSDAAASMARGMVTGEASGALQQWLSHFGTARVQLDADESFSLKNSQLDLLIPLYDQGDNLVFSQGSLHRTDSRSQANLGVGLRHFTPTYMLGGNLFGDYDLSRDHARMGIGVEYWRDFMKLGANGYMRLTNWKDSPDLADYQERPANGWDIRMQAWVPTLPQLGGKLTYEQYYGDEVALFGVDSRQKNPHAITAEINYTPVPLITLGAAQRQGQSGKNDTRLTLDMNYRFGEPWQAQIDPMAVASMRSLAGSRYELVERNNNIVLEYRKKEVLRLHTASQVTGHAGEQKSLGVSVTSTYGVSHIDWDAAALRAAGGKIVQRGVDYEVVLPAYQSAAQAVNSYTVSGVAVDIKGNRSDRSDTQVTVQAPDVDKHTSTFTPANSTLPADGESSQILTLTLRDENNQAVDVDVQDISLKNSTLKSAAVSALTKKSAGVYTLTVTAGTDNETVTVTPSVNGITLSPAKVAISTTTPASPDQSQSLIARDKASYVSGDDMFITVTLKDKNGAAITGEAGLLTSATVTVPNASPKAGSSWKDNGDGTYTTTYTAETASTDNQATLKLSGWSAGSSSDKYAITVATPDQGQSLIARDKASYASGDDMLITVTLKDKNGAALTGDAGLLTDTTVKVPNAVLKTGSSWTDKGDGTYTATYTAETASTDNQATLKLSGWSAGSMSEKYAITLGDEAPASINTQVNPNTFTQTSEEGSFPTTGFTGATFTIVPKNSKKASDYTWKSDTSWVSVTDGVVKFTGAGTGSKVTITGTPISSQGNIIKYSFTLKSWFINHGATTQTWSDASSYCASLSGYSLPTIAQITNDTWAESGSHDQSRAANAGLWSEWGALSGYSDAGFSGTDYWSSTSTYYVGPASGSVYEADHSFDPLVNVMCRRGF